MECLPDGVLAWHVAGGAQPFLRMHLACVRIVPLLWQPGLARGLAAKLAIESS